MSLPTARNDFYDILLRNSYGAVVQREADNGLKIHTVWVRIPLALFCYHRTAILCEVFADTKRRVIALILLDISPIEEKKLGSKVSIP